MLCTYYHQGRSTQERYVSTFQHTHASKSNSLSDLLRPFKLQTQQPGLVRGPVAAPEQRGREWTTRSREFTKRASSRGSFAVKRHLNAYNGFQPKSPRRPQISAPSNFRHVDHAMPRRGEMFRPLELSIYAPENQLSPLLSHFGTIDDMSLAPNPRDKELPAFPPLAMVHSRSDSAMSNHRIPRKPISSSSHVSMDWPQPKQRPDSPETRELLASLEAQLPQAPAPARLRSMTAPASYERVKTALQEKRLLEQKLRDIEETIEERKSLYMSSRPTSRATSRARSIMSEAPGTSFCSSRYLLLTASEPLPLPPNAPSFAERITSSTSSLSRPKTAPSQPFRIPVRATPFSQASAAFATSPSSNPCRNTTTAQDHPLPPPPLPMILRAGVRPPLRKKKSFSRVSNWLFPSEHHSRNTSLDSITNAPKAITSREGFYQCVSIPNGQKQRQSFDSIPSTLSTFETDRESEQPSPPTTWSPQSTPGQERVFKGAAEPRIRSMSIDEDAMAGGEGVVDVEEKGLDISRTRTFGEDVGQGHGQGHSWDLNVNHGNVGTRRPFVPERNSVGIAF